MDLLARSLWKQVFLKKFHSLPANRAFRKLQRLLPAVSCILLTQLLLSKNHSEIRRSAARRVGRSMEGLFTGCYAQLPGIIY